MKRRIGSQILASILVNAIYTMKNYPIMLVWTFLSPFSLLLVIFFVSNGTLLGVGIEGALVMSMVLSGISMQGDLSHLRNDMKLQDMVVSSPTSALIYIVGMAISELVYSAPALTVLGILAVLFIHTTIMGAVQIFLVMALMFAFSIALGFMLSTFSSDVIQSWAFSGIVSTFLSTIPPVYYPITYIPLPYRYIAYLSPTTYAAQIAQNAAGYVSVPAGTVVVDWIVLIGVSILILFIAAKKTRWRER
ncbi:MAG: ABC transporter permease [Candidatus Micrarchaeota archaeon]|nr:ABC transporter permease [Candidatus Micrarchaeota archaeon]